MASYRELVDLDGKLAIHLGTYPEQDKPRTVSHYRVSDYPATHDFVVNLVGKIVHGHNSGYGYAIRPNGTDITVDYRQWTAVTISTPVPMPKNGRTYTWVWLGGKWVRSEFPRCDECREWHDPTYGHCDYCGKPLARGSLHRRCKVPQAELLAEIAAEHAPTGE